MIANHIIGSSFGNALGNSAWKTGFSSPTDNSTDSISQPSVKAACNSSFDTLAAYRRHPREMIAEIGADGQLDWLRFPMV